MNEKYKFMTENKGYRLYLDDIRTPKTNGWEIVRCYEDFVTTILTKGLPTEISFDHDLGEEHINYFFENIFHSKIILPIFIDIILHLFYFIFCK